MTAETKTDGPVPSWATVTQRVLDAIRDDASRSDPARAGSYAGVDPERVRGAIDRGDVILAAHRCYGDGDAIDIVLARSALLVTRALLRPRTGETDGR